MTKEKFMSDIIFYKYMLNENLPFDYKSQHIDDDIDDEPKEPDWFSEEGDRQDTP